MSYSDKIGKYQGDCKIILGNLEKYENFSDHIREFSKTVSPASVGLDLGVGPDSVNGKFFAHCVLDGCDVVPEVVDSMTSEYRNKYVYYLGGGDTLPYADNTLDFLVCSCVVQHLSSWGDFETGMREIHRVLKKHFPVDPENSEASKHSGKFFFMFKAGTHNTLLTHFNSFYSEQRTFRVFSPNEVKIFLESVGFTVDSETIFMDDNWIPYCCMICKKV